MQWMKEKLKKRKYQMKRGLKCGSFFQDIKKIKPKYANQFKFLYFSFILSLKN